MSPDVTNFDFSTLTASLGESAAYDVDLYLPPLELAGREYIFVPDTVRARLTLINAGRGYSARLEFTCRLEGACWRCLEPADIDLDIRVEDYFETELPPLDELGDEDEPTMWYMEDWLLDLSAWAHDAVAEVLPAKILCAADCRGLCPQCGMNLNTGQCDCRPPVDFRWEKLKDWKPG